MFPSGDEATYGWEEEQLEGEEDEGQRGDSGDGQRERVLGEGADQLHEPGEPHHPLRPRGQAIVHIPARRTGVRRVSGGSTSWNSRHTRG